MDKLHVPVRLRGHFAFFKPGAIDEILVGKIWEFDVSQTLLTTFLALMAIPIFMVVLSMTLPARANRITNLIVASVQVPSRHSTWRASPGRTSTALASHWK